MGSCNMGVMTKGDIEDQLHNPNNPKWFVDRKYILRPNREDEANKLGYFIFKIPEYWRQPPTAFSPKGWQFGLHNRENLDNSGSEAIKLGIALQYGLVGKEWDHFCDAIVDDPKALMACYGLQNGGTKWIDEQIKYILALDALFLAYIFDNSLPENERRLGVPNALPSPYHENNMFYSKYYIWVDIMHFDLYQVENQIPLILIDKVVEYINNFIASPSSNSNDSLLCDSQYQQRSIESTVENVAYCVMDTSCEAFKIHNSSPFGERTHILGATHQVICGSKGSFMKQIMYGTKPIHVLSATKLEQSSIKIVGIEGPLCLISYENQRLRLPKMKIFDETCSFIRNMVWYENNIISGNCLFNDYISLMSDLIQAPEDLDLLIKCGVIDNGCGIKAFEMWKALDEGLTIIPSSQIYHKIKDNIESRCKHRRYRLWSEFKITFCSKPWVVLSTIVVVFMTVATIVQTYISIIGSNKMKPNF